MTDWMSDRPNHQRVIKFFLSILSILRPLNTKTEFHLIFFNCCLCQTPHWRWKICGARCRERRLLAATPGLTSITTSRRRSGSILSIFPRTSPGKERALSVLTELCPPQRNSPEKRRDSSLWLVPSSHRGWDPVSGGLAARLSRAGAGNPLSRPARLFAEYRGPELGPEDSLLTEGPRGTADSDLWETPAQTLQVNRLQPGPAQLAWRTSENFQPTRATNRREGAGGRGRIRAGGSASPSWSTSGLGAANHPVPGGGRGGGRHWAGLLPPAQIQIKI